MNCVFKENRSTSSSELRLRIPLRKFSSAGLPSPRLCMAGMVERKSFAIFSRTAAALRPFAWSSRNASDPSTPSIPSRTWAVSIWRWPSLSVSFAVSFNTVLQSVVSGISTEVEIRSLCVICRSTSARISSSMCPCPKNIVTSGRSSRNNPSRRCSVSMEGLPYRLASKRAKKISRRALSV